MLKGKKIVLGITGSIAAYKAAYLTRLLIKEGAEVQTIITPSGKEFITPVTLSTLSQKPVLCDFFTAKTGQWNSHVDLGLWADLMLIAPATAATIGKMANGIADNFVVTAYLSTKAPVFVAPAMDLDMYEHPSTQLNLEKLRSYGNQIIEPGEGELASGLTGKGRMEEPENIVAQIVTYFAAKDSLSGQTVLLTAGPTYETIDPVRFIGNHSSGKMGFALAEEAANRGANVLLITGPVSLSCRHPNIHRIDVVTAQEMYEQAVNHFSQCRISIFCAAVADFTPDTVATKKIKREKDDLVLTLKPTKDIAAELGAQKNGQLMVGFALETNDELSHAHKKMKRKNLDFIVLNSLKDKGAGFQHTTNKITIIDSEGVVTPYQLKEKTLVAKDILDKVESKLDNK